MAVDLKEAKQILSECTAQGLVVMVGYALHFLKPLKIVKDAIDAGRIGSPLSLQASVGRFLPVWRPSGYTRGISARREFGGGVVFELSHKLDYARWLMGEPSHISAMTATVSGLPIDVEDVADINLRFNGGALGSIHMDMIDRVLHRGCRVSGSDGTMVWEFDGKHRVSVWQASTGKWEILFDDAAYDYQEMYIDYCCHFLKCVKSRQQPCVSGQDGYKALDVKDSARTERTVQL